MLTVFFSYSHKDEAVRDELEVHLSMLKRQGVVEAWHDRRIPAGNDLDSAISENLERADVILLLVSPYFLASSYCYDVEVKRALGRHEAKQARVIPLIVDPCDWKVTPFAKLLALPKDGKPISKYPNQHDAFLEIVQAIREIGNQRTSKTEKRTATLPPSKSASTIEPEVRSSNLRIKKLFTDQDRDVFLEVAYEYVAKYFQGSLSELEARNPGIAGKFRQVNANHFTAEIYRNGTQVSACGIRLAAFFGRTKQIVYSDDPDTANSMNESIDVANDGFTMFLVPTGFSSLGGGRTGKQQLSHQGAAEFLWGLFIASLQR